MAHRLEESEWLPQAERMLTGGRLKARGDHHDCGDGGSLMLSRDGNELSAYCFRCGGKGFKREQESLTEQLARMSKEREADDRVRFAAELPEPREYRLSEWPRRNALWFYKMGLSPSKIGELGMYWCAPLGRIVLPIYEDDHAVFWMARAEGRTPKWLAPSIPKNGLAARYGIGKGDTIVLTEDPLSAYMVGRVTEAWSLLGTKLHPRHTTALAATGKRVAVWLDDDKGRRGGKNPGQEAASEIQGRLRALGFDVRNITSPRDPKYYGRAYIEEKIGG